MRPAVEAPRQPWQAEIAPGAVLSKATVEKQNVEESQIQSQDKISLVLVPVPVVLAAIGLERPRLHSDL